MTSSRDRSQITELLTSLDAGPLVGRDVVGRDVVGRNVVGRNVVGRDVVERLMQTVYPNLRRLARKYLAEERPGHTLDPTAVVHEAYCRLVDDRRLGYQGRTHFFAIGAKVMRRVLIEHARARGRAKRGGEWQRISLFEERRSDGQDGLDMEQLLTLHEALGRLAELDPRQAEILELRFFSGLTVREVADYLGVSKRTVEGEWAHARAWLQRELERVGP